MGYNGRSVVALGNLYRDDSTDGCSLITEKEEGGPPCKYIPILCGDMVFLMQVSSLEGVPLAMHKKDLTSHTSREFRTDQ